MTAPVMGSLTTELVCYFSFGTVRSSEVLPDCHSAWHMAGPQEILMDGQASKRLGMTSQSPLCRYQGL